MHLCVYVGYIDIQIATPIFLFISKAKKRCYKEQNMATAPGKFAKYIVTQQPTNKINITSSIIRIRTSNIRAFQRVRLLGCYLTAALASSPGCKIVESIHFPLGINSYSSSSNSLHQRRVANVMLYRMDRTQLVTREMSFFSPI